MVPKTMLNHYSDKCVPITAYALNRLLFSAPIISWLTAFHDQLHSVLLHVIMDTLNKTRLWLEA